MSGKRTINEYILLLLPSLALIGHAMWSIYNGRIVIKGGTEYLYSDSPFKFSAFLTLELALSIYVLYQFLFKNEGGKEQ